MYSFRTLSKSKFADLWRKQTNKDLPARSKDIEEFYPIKNYVVMFRGERIVGAIGFTRKDGLTLRGGSFISPEFRGQGLFGKIVAEADKLEKPFIAGIYSKDVPIENWAKFNESKGWTINPTNKELGNYANNLTVQAFKNYYENDPRNSRWAVKGMPLEKSWMKILKRIEVVPEENLISLNEFVKAEDKGYPSVIHPLKIVAEFDDETDKLKGYTSFRDFGDFYFVGNSFSFVKGSFGKVMEYRKRLLGSSKPKITLLNPLQGTDVQRLENFVKGRGGVKITSYSQVDDIMNKDFFDRLNILTMFRYPPLKGD